MNFWVTTRLYGDDGAPGEMDTQYDGDDTYYTVEAGGVLNIRAGRQRTRISPAHWIKVSDKLDDPDPEAFAV